MEHRWPTGSPRRPLSLCGLSCRFSGMWPSRWTTPTATGQVLGTVHYMSPEQISGEPVDGRSDLYSLGVVGFRALTGRLPFDNEVASAVLVAHVVKPPPKVREMAPRVPE